MTHYTDGVFPVRCVVERRSLCGLPLGLDLMGIRATHPIFSLNPLRFVHKQMSDRKCNSNKMPLTLTLSRPTGEGQTRLVHLPKRLVTATG